MWAWITLNKELLPKVEGVSLIAQLVKNPSVMQETLVEFLGWENLLKKG